MRFAAAATRRHDRHGGLIHEYASTAQGRARFEHMHRTGRRTDRLLQPAAQAQTPGSRREAVNKVLDDVERRAVRQKARVATLEALRAIGGEARREDIRAWALAQGSFTERELAAPPPEAAGEKFPSLVYHDLSWALTNLKHDGLVQNPKWAVWRLTAAGEPEATSAVEEALAPERLAELRAMPYPTYLRTPEWKRTRAAALVRAGNACSLDVSHTDPLEVHHRTYEHLGAELVSDLIVLCHTCHQLHHKTYGRPRKENPDALAPSGLPTAESRELRKPSLLSRLLAR
jgi:hypothetical protein